jgi:putative peptidoglycan lipid II flippase
VTVLLVLAAPLLMRLYLDGSFYEPALAAERESVIDFARYCLPQVFFYGMFVLVGQILNARGTFGPMMWAPIANNVISVAVLVVYLVAFGPAESLTGGFTRNQELVLGLGSTLGIVAQFLILVPFLRAAGFAFRPRFDFRDSGLGHTLRLGMWTVFFVVVNQIAYTVVVRLASSGTAEGTSADPGTGYTVYSSAFLLVMVPHSIITVSLATAILPALSARAADADLAGLGRTLVSTLRTALALIIPFALLLPLVALDVANLVWGYGAAAPTYENFAPSLALFGAGILFFTVHYLMLRGFYALERTRTVFWVQCVISAVNITLAVLFVATSDAEDTSPALVLAYTGAYAVGACGSYLVLRRLLGGLETPRLVRFLVRALLAAGLAAALAGGAAWLLADLLGDDRSKLESLVFVGVVATIDGVLYLLLARAFRLDEVNELVETVTRRLPLRRGA